MRHAVALAVALLVPTTLAAVAAQDVASTRDGATPSAAPRVAGAIVLGEDGRLRFRVEERGTPEPIHLVLDRADGNWRRRGRGRERARGTLPATVRVEHAPAREWAARADSLFGRAPAAGDSLVVALDARGGAMALVRVPDRGSRQRYHLHIATPAGHATAVADSADAWTMVQLLRGAGENLDPEGRLEPGRVYRWDTELDKLVLPARGCYPRYPELARVNGITGQVRVQFVVTGDGLADPATLKVLESSDRQFEVAVREALPCMRFAPAELRGQKVRMLVQQPFNFDIAR